MLVFGEFVRVLQDGGLPGERFPMGHEAGTNLGEGVARCISKSQMVGSTMVTGANRYKKCSVPFQDRCLPEAAASTAGVIHLCLRWACEESKQTLKT